MIEPEASLHRRRWFGVAKVVAVVAVAALVAYVVHGCLTMPGVHSPAGGR